MDWGIDPARVAEIQTVATSRRFSARDTEKFVLAITGGGSENTDMPLWDMLQVLFCLGALTARPGLGPRDAAIACMLDESGILLAPLRRDGLVTASLAGAATSASSQELALALDGGKTRSFSWNRVRRALGLADFLFAAEGARQGETGLVALRNALDIVFSANGFGDDCLKRAMQEPARFMRAWRRQHLPLLAFAEMIRQREAFLHAHDRRQQRRELDPDDLVAFWSFALDTGETWSFARCTERFCALLREERAGVGRRDMMAPVPIETLIDNQPSENPEEALIAWLDHQAALGEGEDHAAEDDPDFEPDEPEDDGEDGKGEEGLRERVSLALSRLPTDLKLLNKEERETVGRALALLPLAHEQPLTLLRARAVAPWENRLVEASRRAVGSQRAPIDQSTEIFDYAGIGDELAGLCRRFDELLLIAAALGAIGGTTDPAVTSEGHKALKRWRHDRASFRIEDAKLALIFARHESGLRTVASALHRIVRQQRRLRETSDLVAQAATDTSRFGDVFATRYLGRMRRP